MGPSSEILHAVPRTFGTFVMTLLSAARRSLSGDQRATMVVADAVTKMPAKAARMRNNILPIGPLYPDRVVWPLSRASDMKRELMKFSFFVVLFLALIYAKNRSPQKFLILNSNWKGSGQSC